ncbi:MAG: hypothetical protein Q8L48_13805 [Archangium sp.]|nr:hypothetical protein [Archangium sp.]
MLFLLVLIAATPVPADLVVPAELTAKTCNPELSGVTWVPALGRYLAISDDTGLLDTPTWHAPWVLTFDEKGRFDAAPRVLEGLEALDDAESITPGPPGTFFLTTSHTISKKGKSKPIRRRLLWLELKEQRLLVRGGFDLTTLISARAEDLDIEALAFRDGALFVGLKAPLDENGHAAIMRIENIVGAFDQEKPATLTAVAWARPKLEVPDAEGKPVPEGVTDLLFLSDGRLVLAANAPKSGKADGGGAIWLLRKPDAKPVLLHRFSGGLKPEGLSLSPDGKRLVVVFDRGAEISQWVQLPVP